MTRRLATAVFLSATLLASNGNAQGSFDKKLPEDRQVLHVLNRLTFGPRAGDIDEVRRLGLERWINLQLHPDQISDNPVMESRLELLDTLRMTPDQIAKSASSMMLSVRGVVFIADGNGTVSRPAGLESLLTPDQIRATKAGPEELYKVLSSLDIAKRQSVIGALPQDALAGSPELRRLNLLFRNPTQIVTRDLQEGKVFRALYSDRQLEEVLVDFWFNHFNVDEAKPFVRNVLSSYERDVIRPHVLGKFKDMLLATAWHPAMLLYLDNWESMAPEAYRPGPNQTIQMHASKGLNENYGRELLELHTLGVDGGYTQQDVIAAAQAFAGWTINSTNDLTFHYWDFAHTKRDLTFIRHPLQGKDGIQNGADVIDILARHPSTARFISKELAKRFVADNPPQSLVDRMASTFTATDGDLRAVMETMFRSTEFLSEGAWRSKVKSPLEIVVSSVRALGGETTDAYALARWIADMGEPLYNKLEPTGYPNAGDAWLNTAGLLSRIKFASALSSGKVEGVSIDQSPFEGKDTTAIARALLGGEVSVETQTAISNGAQGPQATARYIEGLVLASPEFQRR